jgi:hypothetical protein
MRPHLPSATLARLSFIAAATLSAAFVACRRPAAHPATEASTVAVLARGHDESVQRDLQRLRTAIGPYADLALAQKAGYPTKVPPCIRDSAGAGGMGHHYFDRTLYDSIVELEKPEMLLYAPQRDGSVKLVAVEYVVPYRLRPSTSTPPVLFGQPFRKHEQFQYWYLHVWAWEQNPTGLFEDWNPRVDCPQ